MNKDQVIINNFTAQNLTIVKTDYRYKAPESIQPAINKIWDELLQKVASNGGKLWNGIVYRTDKFEKKGLKTILYLGTLDFKTHYASRWLQTEFDQHPFEDRPNGMFISVYITTNDNKYLLTVKAQNSTAITNVNLFGGVLNEDEQKVESVEDLFEYVRLEFFEESGLAKNSLTDFNGVSIFINNNQKIAVVVSAKLNMTAAEFFEKSKLSFEHQKFLGLSREEVQKLIDDKESGISENIRLTFDQITEQL